MPTIKELEGWMSTGQVANRLGKSRQGALWLAEHRKIWAAKTVIGWLYDPQSVEEYARQESPLRGGAARRERPGVP